MYINFQHNRDSRSVKTVYINVMQKYRKFYKFATTNSNFEKNQLFRTCKSNVSKNRGGRSIKTVLTNLFAKHRELHKVATYNSNLKNSCLSDMHYPITDRF